MIIPSTVQTTSHAPRLLQLEPVEDAAVPQHRMKRFVIKWELKGTSVVMALLLDLVPCALRAGTDHL